MSKRGQIETATDENVDNLPVRRSSRISSGQNLAGSPAPKAIMTRRSSANSNSEKNIVEASSSPMDKRRTRRTSTDEEPKPAPIRSRRSSVSKVIEEEKAAIPNSPSRRTTRMSSSSPSLDVPARRTRRSSQDSDTVEVPAGRSTRRSSTGLQETSVEEIIEKAKPAPRRRRSTSIDEEDNTKVETRPKTKRLFNEDSQLEPIKEQEQEVKEKEAPMEKLELDDAKNAEVMEKEAPVEKNEIPIEKQEIIHSLEVIEEIADDDSERILDCLNEALEETNQDSDVQEIETSNIKEKEEMLMKTNEKNDVSSSEMESIPEQSGSMVDNNVESPLEINDSLEEKSSPKKCSFILSESEEKFPNNTKSCENLQSGAGELKNKSSFDTNTQATPVKSPIVQLKSDKESTEKVEIKMSIFSSPGSDKENTSINVPKNSLPLKLNEENDDDVLAVKKTPRSSLCEPMDVDDDEDDIFGIKTPKKETPKKLISENSIEKVQENGQVFTVQNVSVVEKITEKDINNESIKNTSFTLDGSFSQLNSSPDKESPLVEKSKIIMSPEKSSTLEECKLLPSNNAKENCDSESESSIKLVDTDEEEEARIKAANEKEDEVEATEKNEAPTEIISDFDASILDKSFGSDKHQSLCEKNSENAVVEDSFTEPIERSELIRSNSEVEIIDVENSDDSTDNVLDESITQSKQIREISPKRKSIGEKTTSLTHEVVQNTESESNPESESCSVEVDVNEEPNKSISLNNTNIREDSVSEEKRVNVQDCTSDVIEIAADQPLEEQQKSIENVEETENNILPEQPESRVHLPSSDCTDQAEKITTANDSTANISVVKTEKESDLSENENQKSMQFGQDSIKVESKIEMNTSLNQSNDKSKDNIFEKSSGESSEAEYLTPTHKSVEKMSEIVNTSNLASSPSTIILQSVKVIKNGDTNGTSAGQYQKANKSRNSLPSDDLNDKKESELQKTKTTITQTRLSLPSRILVEKQNTSTPKRTSENVEEQCEKNIQTNIFENQVNLISSSDEEDNAPIPTEDSSKRKYSVGDIGNESTLTASSENIEVESDGIKKRKSEETGGKKKKLKTCPGEQNNEEDLVIEENKPPKKKIIHSKKTIEIMAKSGIDIEDEGADSSSFLDDMAEEGEESLDEEVSDEYEIKDEGESVMSSDEDEESFEDDYDSDDSFIDDEEQELLSGEEEFLGIEIKEKPKEKRKFRKIIEASSSSDEVVEETLPRTQEGTPAATLKSKDGHVSKSEKAKASEEQIDSILKSAPVEICGPNQTISDVINSSRLSESSVILQETCSVGAAKSKVILDKIHGMVDVFCKSINESEGNISLNVSLNYKPPENSFTYAEKTDNQDGLNVSLGKTSRKSHDGTELLNNSLSNKSRLSREKRKKRSLSPKTSNNMEVENEEGKTLQSHYEEVVETPSISSRLSIEKQKKKSLTPKKLHIDDGLNISLERTSRKSYDGNELSNNSFSNKSSRLSSEKRKKHSMSPQKSKNAVVENEEVEPVQSHYEEVVETPSISSRLSIEKQKKKSLSPKKLRVEDGLNVSSERTPRKSNDSTDLPNNSFGKKSSRSSEKRRKHSLSPQKSKNAEVENEEVEPVQSHYEEVVETPIISSRQSIEKQKSLSPQILVIEDETKNNQNEVATSQEGDTLSKKVKKSKKNKKKTRDSRTLSPDEKEVVPEEKISGSVAKDEKSSKKGILIKTGTLEKKQETESSTSLNKKERTNKKKRTENTDHSNEKEELKQETKKKKIRFNETNMDELVSIELKKSHKQASSQNKDKSEKRKNVESSDKEVPSKKLRISEYNQNFKEMKPTKHSKNSDRVKSSKTKIEIKTTNSNNQNDWDEEDIDLKPSAANTSVSGFNFEKLINKDFKNRMIYDSSRNRREPSGKTKKHHKKSH